MHLGIGGDPTRGAKMEAIAMLVGGSIGMMMGSPWILVAGYLLAKNSPREQRTWGLLVLAAVVCMMLSVGFEAVANGGTFPYSFMWLFMLHLAATFWAMLIFLLVRWLRGGFRAPLDEEVEA